ncbi:MAG: hypothetical protein ACTHU0_04235 [Kofleriaceae bacterium]
MIGEALAAACRDPAVLARIGGPLGEAARAAAGQLAQLPHGEQRARRARWAAAARAPVPAGIRGVHPSWIEDSLAGLPARARDDVARGGGGDRAAVWLARWACAALPPLTAVDDHAAATSIEGVAWWSGARIAAWLASVGADQLALAMAAAGPAALAAAVRAVGAPLDAAASRISAPPRAGALGPARAAIARCRVALDDRALVRIGARAIAPHVHALARRQLAVRLARPLGLVVLDELAAHARDPVDQAPSWAALGVAG